MKENPAIEQLQKRVAKAPTTPGIYRWLNAKGEVLYIGKAKNLRNRLRSYVQSADTSQGPWKLSLRKHIADFDVTVTATELEALILETTLIKEKKPKYNVLMKDDKNYVYVRISVEDKYPHLSVTRSMERDGAKYFGPYLTAYNIKRVLDLLHTLYNFRACDRSIEQHNKKDTADIERTECLEAQLGKCNGLCTGSLSQEEYSKRIASVITFLKGNYDEAMRHIQQLMQEAALEKRFEKAAKMRDALKYIESLQEDQVVSGTSGANTDAIGIALQAGKIQIVVLQERNGKLIDERCIEVRGEADDAASVLEQFLPQYYRETTDVPDTILVGHNLEDHETLEAWLNQIHERRIAIVLPERGKKSKLLKMAETNATQKITQLFAKWEAKEKNIASALKQLQKHLDLPCIPKRIEGYDISHHSGTETVGAMVVMKNGKLANAEYRSFTIRTLEEGTVDDYKALREVLKRRTLHLLRNVKRETVIWKERGIRIGKARKADLKAIEEIHAQNAKNLSKKYVDYKDYVLAHSEDGVVGMGRVFLNPDAGVLLLQSLWVDEAFRGIKLGQAIVRALLAKQKKEKIYIITKPNLEQYYAGLGFRHVHEPPKGLHELHEKLIQMEKEKTSEMSCGLLMVYIPSENKEDVSLGTLPDLLLIDGGKGQLSTALSIFHEFDFDIPVVSIAKREEILYTKNGPVENLPEEAQFLLQRLRDEAHRFSNRHRETRVKNAMKDSFQKHKMEKKDGED